MKILVTGGAGYIGSTVCSALIDSGHTPIILDSLVTGCEDFVKGHIFYKADISCYSTLEKIMHEHPDISCCMHFAARISVSESVEVPLLYYTENVTKSIALFSSLRKLGIKKIIFSSSASVYNVQDGFEVTEVSSVAPASPYARTKLAMEMVLEDFCNAGYFKGIALRYFNPIGADKKMRTGPFVKDPSHIIGKLTNVAIGKEPTFYIFGSDWPTRDGTAIRDYIHIWDLAMAHVVAAEGFDDAVVGKNFDIINLGSGNGITVNEFVQAFERVHGSPLNVSKAPRRQGDVVGAFANCSKANAVWSWKAKLSIDDGISDMLCWTNKFRSCSHSVNVECLSAFSVPQGSADDA